MWYNQTEIATKEELETVKGMIEVSARLVGVYGYYQSENTVDIECDFDYIKIICQHLPKITDASNDVKQESIRYLVPGGTCTVFGNCNTEDGFDFSMIKATLVGRTLSFYSNTRNNQSLTTEASVSGITIEIYKYQ